jgi:putative ATP-dependent endonuclease of OLD family
MRTSSLTLKNFRCFGPDVQTIEFGNLVALVGNNGCGKSAVLVALTRLFGVTSHERTLQRTDFHLGPDQTWDDAEEINLLLETLLDFPELKDGDDTIPAPAACFRHMTIAEPNGNPYCIARLSATWCRSNLPEGEIESDFVWVTGDPGGNDERTSAILSHDRSRIHVHYIPATRDPVRQIKQVSGSMLHTLLRAVEWSDDARKEIEAASETIREAVGETTGVQTIAMTIKTCWKELHSESAMSHVTIRPVAKRIEDLISQVEASFSPTPGGAEEGIEKLSDGQKSLFYLALMATVFDVHRKFGSGEEHGFSEERLMPPVLSLLAVEEPENHISPYYLGRIVGVLSRISKQDAGQVVLTSHSASILGRVEPDEIRHLRLDPATRATVATDLDLPDREDERGKFVREAVRAHPELYFARFVVLGEGATEEIVIPRAVSAMGVDIDPNFVAMVPLGGRHVNHFWKLLRQIGIPFVTLLDLDLEREGGGWSRIKYALLQLLEVGIPENELLGQITRETVGAMHTRETTNEYLTRWLRRLERYDVYFSAPLDLDFLMLRTFPYAYQTLIDGELGPRIPNEEDEPDVFAAALSKAKEAVLSQDHNGDTTYAAVDAKLFFWYRYLFIGRGKPATHTLSLLEISLEALRENLPEPLASIVDKIKATIVQPEPPEDAIPDERKEN